MNRTKINYLTHTWNPLAMRCTRVDAGCANCWHLRLCDIRAKNPKLSAEVRAAHAGETGPLLVEERLAQPLRRRTPAVIGVQFMGDLVHEGVHVDQVREVWGVMEATTQHTFIVLTKRPGRMRKWLLIRSPEGLLADPLPNVWLGVSVHDQASADKRIPILLQIPAVGHFVSYEPALGPVDFACPECDGHGWWGSVDDSYACEACGGHEDGRGSGTKYGRIDGIIMGGESGSGARPMHPDWARDTRDQCEAAGIPFHFKQWGEWAEHDPPYTGRHWGTLDRDGQWWPLTTPFASDRASGFEVVMTRIGKKAAGRLLDGVEHNELPWELPNE